MAQPPAYNRTVDFTDQEGDNTNHTALNAELDGAAQSINAIRTNLAQIQKDDGSLKITLASLGSVASEIQTSVNAAAASATSAANAAASATASEANAVAASNSAANAKTVAQASAVDAAASAQAAQNAGAIGNFAGNVFVPVQRELTAADCGKVLILAAAVVFLLPPIPNVTPGKCLVLVANQDNTRLIGATGGNIFFPGVGLINDIILNATESLVLVADTSNWVVVGGSWLARRVTPGIGQTWQNVAGSRLLNTTYTNTTDKPIYFKAQVSYAVATGGFASATAFVSVSPTNTTLITVERFYNATVTPATQQTTLSAMVPPGCQYRVNVSGSVGLVGWAELRA